jgi:hypothetical protein
MVPVRYYAAVDLGQTSEPTALAVLAQRYAKGSSRYSVRHLQRWQAGTAYHHIATEIARVLGISELAGCELVIDRTGVGRAAASLFTDLATSVRSVVISAGHVITYAEDGSVHVPKKELVATLQVLLQGRRLQIAAGLPLAELFVREMESFRTKVLPTHAEALADWREREHDDLVLAVALAAWQGERSAPDVGEPLVFDDRLWLSRWT